MSARHAASRGRVPRRLVVVYVLLGVMVGCGGVHVALVGPGRPLVTPWLVAGVVAGVAAACVGSCLDVCPPEAVEEAAGSVEEAVGS